VGFSPKGWESSARGTAPGPEMSQAFSPKGWDMLYPGRCPGLRTPSPSGWIRLKGFDRKTTTVGRPAMGITYLKGDATCPQAKGVKIVCHVCNDIGGWGKGFVLALSKRWAGPEAEYRRWYAAGRAGGFALGAGRFVPVEPYVWVANMGGQRGVKWGSSGPPIRYEGVAACLAQVAVKAREVGASVPMPRIGCGLAGGDWAVVEPLIKQYLIGAGVPVTVYDFE
jgi:O-acetyl-ADP-ribose deacetylase (regulator of RNase III)